MPSIHLMAGFIGFGKTPVSKMLEKSFPAGSVSSFENIRERLWRAPAGVLPKKKNFFCFFPGQGGANV